MTDVETHALTHTDQAGTTTAVVVPDWGMNVVGLWYQPHLAEQRIPILEQVDIDVVARKPTSFGIPVLAPAPGRTGRNQDGLFRYHEKSYRAEPPRHGMLRNLSWSPVSVTAQSIAATVTVVPVSLPGLGPFPYNFVADYRVELMARGLRCHLEFQNIGTETQPFSAGWHPYFHRPERCAVRLPARSRWQLDELPEPTPTGTILDVHGSEDLRVERELSADEHWDDIFTDLDDSDGVVRAWARDTSRPANGDPSMRFVQFACRTKLDGVFPIRHLQLFTPPGRNAICLEPLSSPPNALNLMAAQHPRSHVCELAPGERVAFELDVGIA